jgi:hypothetical protein
MTDALRKRFCIGDYELDATPSEQQAQVLWRIYDGDRIVADTRGATYAWERGGKKAAPASGRGAAALLRYRNVTHT